MNSTIRELIPPIVFKLARRAIKGRAHSAPEWTTVQEGPNSGCSFFVSADRYREQLDGTNDKSIWNIIEKLDLQGSSVIDVGAHIGFYSLALSKQVGPNGNVHAFEPNMANSQRLKLNPESVSTIF